MCELTNQRRPGVCDRGRMQCLSMGSNGKTDYLSFKSCKPLIVVTQIKKIKIKRMSCFCIYGVLLCCFSFPPTGSFYFLFPCCPHRLWISLFSLSLLSVSSAFPAHHVSSGGGFSRFTCTLLINGVCIQSWFSLLTLSVHPVLRPCVIFVLSSCVVPCVFHLSLFTAVPSGVLRHLPVSPRVARFYFFT